MQRFLITVLTAVCACAHADEVTLIAPGGIRAPIQKMIPDFERRTGHTVKATFGSGTRAEGGALSMEMLAKGEVEIGLTFLSEIHDPGVEVVGILPPEISTPTALVGFVSTKAKSPEAAKALLKYLSGPEAAVVYKAVGMQAGK